MHALRDAGEPVVPGHRATKNCELMRQARELRRTVAAVAKALDVRFHIQGVQLDNVAVFKYLGRFMALDDVDTQAASGNPKKARRVWARILNVLRAENASARVCGMLYKATVQSVLLFGSETWALTPSTPSG